MLEEVQQLSLREVGIVADTLEPPREHRRRERSRERSRGSRNSGREERRSRSRNPPLADNETGTYLAYGPSTSREGAPPRVIEHQSSLRSLLSASEIDSAEIEEEIMRQIMEEGLLDGIDLNNIDVSQEDEISERIAQAYRRRQAERQRQRRERRERLAREGRVEQSPTTSVTSQELRSPSARNEEQQRRRPHARTESGTSTPAGQPSSRQPPISRPGLIDAANQGARTHHRRSSSQGSSRSSRRADRPAALAVTSTRQAAVSAGDLGERPATSDSTPRTRRRQSDNQQRGTLEGRQQFRNSLQAHSSSNPNSPRRAAFNILTSESPSSSTTALVSSPTTSPPASTPTNVAVHPSNTRRTTDPTSVRQSRNARNGTPPMLSPSTFPRPTTGHSTGQETQGIENAVTVAPAPTLYQEPAISCNRCGKEHIEYEVHHNCSRCDQGQYNLCQSCYRAGKGCKHWYGFGWAAWARYERQAPPGGYPPNHEHPHILVGHRYTRPLMPLTESTSPPHGLMSEDEPMHRLEAGVFCDLCKAFANGCYWKCDVCNEGAWGFCNDCVNQGRHCTHPLLPIAHKPKENPTRATTESTTTSDPSEPLPETTSRAGPLSPGLAPPPQDTHPTTPPLTPKTASLIRGPGLITIANRIFRPLTFTTVCNICTYPIPPSHTRYHCLKCNKGDYDICMSCYHKLVVSGRIGKEDGMNGWRRCLRGHRMIIVGFEDRDGGQRRIVVRDLVGGFALRESEETEPKSPTSANTNSNSTANFTSSSNWSWRDIDGSIQKYRVSSPSGTSSPSGAPHMTTRFPPDGGVGLRVQANWSYFPAEDVKDELGFPRNAEIREAEDINGDWFWGVYAGRKGLFPGNYGRIVGGREERDRMI